MTIKNKHISEYSYTLAYVVYDSNQVSECM